MYFRLPDPPQSFNKTDALRFSWKNPCDMFLFNGKTRVFYALEAKSSKSKSFSYELEKGTYKTANIHFHQIDGLRNLSKINYTVCGFIFNFRYEDKDIEKTYFQEIYDFDDMVLHLNKKSFNENDLLNFNPILIEQTKLRTNYKYNIDKFLNETRL